MSEIKTDALERVLSWVDNADLADADDIYGYCLKCHGEIAHKDGCDLPIARAELTALRAQVEQGEADSKRIEWLEQNTGEGGYLIAEGKWTAPLRDALDAAMMESSHA